MTKMACRQFPTTPPNPKQEHCIKEGCAISGVTPWLAVAAGPTSVRCVCLLHSSKWNSLYKGMYTKQSHIKDKPMISFASSSFVYREETEALGKGVISKDVQGEATQSRTLYLVHIDMLLPKLHMDPASRMLSLHVGFLHNCL